MRSALCAAVLLVLVGCTTTCRIDSSVSGAKVYLDNALVGITPCDVELDDNKMSYTLKLEHSDCHPWSYLISQQFAGTVSQQQSQTNVNASTNAYGSGNHVTSSTNGTVTQSTQTYNTPVYAWTSRYFVTLVRKPAEGAHATPPPARTTTTTTTPEGQQAGTFCSKCGVRFTGDAQFCSGCGARR